MLITGKIKLRKIANNKYKNFFLKIIKNTKHTKTIAHIVIKNINFDFAETNTKTDKTIDNMSDIAIINTGLKFIIFFICKSQNYALKYYRLSLLPRKHYCQILI